MARAGRERQQPVVSLVTGTAADGPPDAEVVALGVLPDGAGAAPGPDALAFAGRTGIDVAAYLSASRARGTAGEIIAVPLLAPTSDGAHAVRTLLLVGLGDRSVGSLRTAAASAVRRARDADSLATAIVASANDADLRLILETMHLASYTFSMKSSPRDAALRTVSVVHPGGKQALKRATSTAGAVRFARDLINTPSLEKTPVWLAAQAEQAGAASGVEVTVRDVAALGAEGFGGILAVGAGSARPPRLIEMRYRPRGARGHVVLVGKGITFDSGGLSLKPGDGMLTMKTDMAGGAAVIAVMTALRDLGVRVKVTGLVPAAENMPSGVASRPGDVITQYGGQTVEVLNTDAEGRLVLADGLAYAAARLRPDVMVDIATLTGAASLGLGRIHGALFASEDSVAAALLAAAATGGEQLWRMPLVQDYRAGLDSPIADLRNIGDPSTQFSGGAISAALFLREFTGGLPWAHLDVAGPSRSDKDDGDSTKGGTGFGVRLLLRWLEDYRVSAA